METTEKIADKLLERIEDYSKTTYELSKLKLLETSTRVATAFVASASVFIAIIMAMLVLSIGVSFFLGEILGKIYYGFFIVAGVYLFTGILFQLRMHKWIKNPLSNQIINKAIQ